MPDGGASVGQIDKGFFNGGRSQDQKVLSEKEKFQLPLNGGEEGWVEEGGKV